MKYSKEQMELMEAKIIDLLKENGEMRFGKIAKSLIHSGMAESSFIVGVILESGCKEHKNCKDKDLFTSPKTGMWRLSDSIELNK